jgi:hypothetical protein
MRVSWIRHPAPARASGRGRARRMQGGRARTSTRRQCVALLLAVGFCRRATVVPSFDLRLPAGPCFRDDVYHTRGRTLKAEVASPPRMASPLPGLVISTKPPISGFPPGATPAWPHPGPVPPVDRLLDLYNCTPLHLLSAGPRRRDERGFFGFLGDALELDLF